SSGALADLHSFPTRRSSDLHWPDEADHRRALRPILAEAAGWPVTVRLLDFANDKVPPFLFGGPAGLAALLADRDALTAQLRAIRSEEHTSELQSLAYLVCRL